MGKHTPTLRALTASFHYLDVLRESGVTNMYGAVPYLMRDLGRTRDEGVRELSMWMKSFELAKEPRKRARAAISKATGGDT